MPDYNLKLNVSLSYADHRRMTSKTFWSSTAQWSMVQYCRQTCRKHYWCMAGFWRSGRFSLRDGNKGFVCGSNPPVPTLLIVVIFHPCTRWRWQRNTSWWQPSRGKYRHAIAQLAELVKHCLGRRCKMLKERWPEIAVYEEFAEFDAVTP